jgi:sporulation protein YlmC with PRC-barrel domain
LAKTDKPLTKDALAQMQVIDSTGHLVGKVKDVAFVVGQLGISLSVENEDGEIKCIQWQDIQAASDFIILKPQPQGGNKAAACTTEQVQAVQAEEAKEKAEPAPKKQSAQPICPTCNKPLTWISQYSRWYCYNDKKYVNPEESSKNDWEEVFQEKSTEPKKQSSQPLCPTCNKPLTWIPQYSRWYCYNDKKYV